MTTWLGSGIAASVQHRIDRIAKPAPVVPPLPQRFPSPVRHPVILAGWPFRALDQKTLDHALLLKPREKRVDRPFGGQIETTLAKFSHHLITVGSFFIDDRHETHIEDTVEQLCFPVLPGTFGYHAKHITK